MLVSLTGLEQDTTEYKNCKTKQPKNTQAIIH